MSSLVRRSLAEAVGTCGFVFLGCAATISNFFPGARYDTVGVAFVHAAALGTFITAMMNISGGHLNPAARQHGVHNPAGSHFGDLPNLVISGSGTGALTVDLPGTRAEVEAALFDGDGTAIVVHGGPDDYKTDPSGNSGPRIACGVLTRG